jgi:hypothetical protein
MVTIDAPGGETVFWVNYVTWPPALGCRALAATPLSTASTASWSCYLSRRCILKELGSSHNITIETV